MGDKRKLTCPHCGKADTYQTFTNGDSKLSHNCNACRKSFGAELKGGKYTGRTAESSWKL